PSVIMNYDVILYVSQKEKFGGSVFAGTDFPCKQITILSKFPYLVQFTVGGSLNYDILYILAQGYSAIDYTRNADYQVRLAVGINYNMPYQIF
ncbi:unnamed protein product, partial [marine sediment metagenome]